MAFADTHYKPEEIGVGSGVSVMVESEQVGIFRTQDGFYALSNLCPHRGAPLNEGFISDGAVTCPWHQWQFQLENGVCRNIPGAAVLPYPIEIRDGTLWVDVEQRKQS